MSRSKHSLPLTVALAVALPCTVAAASDQAQPSQPTQPMQPTQPHTGAPPSTPGTGTTTHPNAPTHGTASNAPQEEISDAQIITLLEIVSDSDVEHNRKAHKAMKDRRAKKFADTRMKHAKAAKKRQAALKNRNKFKTDRGDAATVYETTVVEVYKDLDTAKAGREYDMAYLDDEIETLTNIVDLIDRKLLPNVDLPELRDELNTVRAEAETDRAEAERIREYMRAKPVT